MKQMVLEQEQPVHPGWDCVCCETIGTSHVQEGTVCQDKTHMLRKNGVTAFALADGAGSARLSHFGAETVTQRICGLLCEEFEQLYAMTVPEKAKKYIIGELLTALERTAGIHGCQLRDLASTLLAVAVCDVRYIIMHIGDGVIGYAKDDCLRVASAPSNGEFANTTTFVTSEWAARDMRIRKGASGEITGFVLMSDGSEASLFSKKQMCLAPVLNRLIQRLSVTSAEFLRPKIQQSLDEVVSRKTRDDCSLVLAAKMERTYRQMDDRELDAYFGLGEEQEPAERALLRTRYAQILDCLAQETSEQELGSLLGLEEPQTLQQWLGSLLELGYLVQTEDGLLRRVVGLPASQAVLNEGKGEKDV